MSRKRNKYVIDTTDVEGRRVVFSRKKWKQKSLVHPELCKQSFIKSIQKALESPTEVWQDRSNKITKRCYYRKYSKRTYVKVVVWVVDDPRRVVSAFETNYIKETKYQSLKRII